MLQNMKVFVAGTDGDSGMLRVYDATSPAILADALVGLARKAEAEGLARFLEGHLLGTGREQSYEEFAASVSASALDLTGGPETQGQEIAPTAEAAQADIITPAKEGDPATSTI